MKNKKLFLPTIILVVSVILMAVVSVVISIAKEPVVKEGEFPFTITYEYNGETVVIDDVYSVKYDRNDGYTDTKTRVYNGTIVGLDDEGTTYYTIRNDDEGRIEINTKLYPDYLMGDSEYDYFDDEAFEPVILYYDSEETEYTDEVTLAEQGVKLISWEYPEPIENSFVFSHISIFDNKVVLPTLLIGFVTLIVCIIFVKKEKDHVHRPIDTVSCVMNYLICIVALPILTILSWLMDITGDNDNFFNQILYFIPALTLLGVAASVCLRRKGFKKSSLWVEYIGIIAFAVVMLIAGLLGL